MSAPPKLTVEIVTGERVVYQADNVDLVTAPGADGELGILPRHAALFSLLAAGELRVRKGAEEQAIVVFGGFLEVNHNRVLVLADSAERVEEIDLERAETARRSAEGALAARGEVVDVEQALAALRRSTIRLKAANRRGRRGQPPSGPGPS
jgi:F-type H+-transporting ATPase subunit epsilon